jgi:hypothetical protein
VRRVLLASILALAALGAGCAARTPPPPPPSAAEDAQRIARIVRLMELNRRGIALEVERAGLSQRYGVNHPQMVSLAKQIEVIDAALEREFHPEERTALAQYGDRAMELRLRIQELFARGRGENHPDVVSAQRQLAAVEAMAAEHQKGADERSLLDRIAREPGAVEPRIELAMLYLRDGRSADAERALDGALKALRKRR